MAAAYLAGCSSGGGSSSSSSSASSTNIVGKVSTSSSASSSSLGKATRLEKLAAELDTSGAGCTAKAYDLNGTSVLATGTADGTGQFTISGGSLTAGQSYKVVTTCSNGNSFTAVMGADNATPASKTPAPVNPLTTLVTTEIVKAIIAAVATATSGLPPAAQLAITNALLTPSVLKTIISTVSTTINAAVTAGTMAAPSAGAASSMSTAVAGASASNSAGITAAENSYKNDPAAASGNNIPLAVVNSVAGAASSAAAFPSCDPTLASAGISSANKCVKAVAQMMANTLNFDVAILVTGGAFNLGGAGNCNAATLGSAFPNAAFYAGNNGTYGIGDAAFCIVHSTVSQQNRNSSYNDNSGGHNGPIFGETGGTALAAGGLLTSIGNALYANKSYKLSDLDGVVFGASGLNGRLVSVTPTYSYSTTSNQPANYSFSVLKVTGGATSLDGSFSWPATCSGSPCDPNNNNVVSLTNYTDWTSNSVGAQVALSTAIGGSAYAGSVFFNMFNGPIPTEDKLASQFLNSQVHNDENRSGQANFFVMYSKNPDWNNPNCQWSSNSVAATTYTIPANGVTTTVCTSTDGTPAPAVTVNIGLGTVDGTTGLSQIDSIVTPVSGTGAYYLFPQMNGKFTGVMQLINVGNGAFLRDEALNPRYVQVITDTNQCGDAANVSAGTAISGLPTHATGGCNVGSMYNVNVAWSCNSGPCTMAVSANSAQAANAINHSSPAQAYSMTVNFQANQIWSTPGQPSLSGAGISTGMNSGGFTEIYVTVNGTGVPQTSGTTVSGLTSGRYAVAQYYNCTTPNAPCVNSGYYLVDNSGTPFTLSGSVAAGLTKATVCVPSMSGCTSTPNTVIYTDTYFATLNNFFHYSDGGAASTWKAVAEQPVVFMGPAGNPNYDCSMDPYYIDANGNGKLDYSVNAGTGAVTCSETHFDTAWSVANYIQGGNGMSAHPGAVVVPNNANGYQYKDPKAASALIHAAFGPWLDGTHSLTATTTLNAFQAFGLIYIFFEGQQNDNILNIQGLLPSNLSSKFMVLTPACGSSGMGSCNQGFATGMTANAH